MINKILLSTIGSKYSGSKHDWRLKNEGNADNASVQSIIFWLSYFENKKSSPMVDYTWHQQIRM